MKTKIIEVTDALEISVNCQRNDWDDIKIGGSAFIGFDFFIDPSEKDEIIPFIEKLLKKHRIPLKGGISEYENKDFPVKNLWDKEKIEKCIIDNKNMF